MAFVHGKNTDFFVAEADLTTYFKEVSMSAEFDMAETSTFGNTYKTFIQGLGASTISASGLYDSAVNTGPDVILNGLVGSTTTKPVTFMPDGNTLGNVAYGMGANLASYEITSSIGDAVMISAQFQSVVNSGSKRGVVLAADAAISATGDQTAQDHGAATTNGGFALLHVTANTRDGAATFKIRHSADNVTYADLVTFTATTSSTRTSEYVQVAAATTVNRWLKFNTSALAGTTGSLTVTCAFVRL